MRLYPDASAILKAYLGEAGADIAARAQDTADEIVASRVLEVEVVGRLLRFGATHASVADFTARWAAVAVIELDDQVSAAAAQLAGRRSLRALDAIHLASALEVADEELVFATWDRRLWDAAVAEGLTVLPETRP